MQIKYEELKRRLKQKTLDPLYLFTGEEIYLIDEAIRSIKNESLTAEEQEANFHTFYADDANWDDLFPLAQTFPFVGKNRLIVLKGLEKMKKGKEETTRLLNFLKKKRLSLIIILTAEKIDQRTKFGKFLTEKAAAVHFYKLFENQVPTWIVQRVKSSGRSISLSLAQIMTQILGNDLSRLDNELTKIYLYMDQDKQITQKHLAIVSDGARIFSVFDLAKNLGEKRPEPSLKILNNLMDEGSNALLLLSMIVRQFRHLCLTKSLMQQGKGAAEVAKSIHLPMIFTRQIIEQAKIFSYERLQTLYAEFLETDLKLKSSSCSPRLILENLVVEICRDSL